MLVKWITSFSTKFLIPFAVILCELTRCNVHMKLYFIQSMRMYESIHANQRYLQMHFKIFSEYCSTTQSGSKPFSNNFKCWLQRCENRIFLKWAHSARCTTEIFIINIYCRYIPEFTFQFAIGFFYSKKLWFHNWYKCVEWLNGINQSDSDFNN